MFYLGAFDWYCLIILDSTKRYRLKYYLKVISGPSCSKMPHSYQINRK